MPENQELPWWLAVPLSLIIGILLVISIPEVKEFFEQLLSLVLAAIFLGIVVGAIILGIIWLINQKQQGRI